MRFYDYFLSRRPSHLTTHRTSAPLMVENLENRCVPTTLMGQFDLGIDHTAPPEGPTFRNLGIFKAAEPETGDTAILLPAVQKVREAAFLSAGSETDETAILLPAVQKVREAAFLGAKSDPDETAILLPAVQKVREAAFQNLGSDAGETAMLLPAVQKVREAAFFDLDQDTLSDFFATRL